MNQEPINVAVPLGIGDVHWALTKVRGLSKFYNDRPVRVHVNKSGSHKTVEFLKLVPFVAEAIESAQAPYDIGRDLLPAPHGWMLPTYSTMKGTKDWRGFTHVMVPNGHLQRGEKLSEWFPEIPFEPSYQLRVPEKDIQKARDLAPRRSVLLYLSGTGPNKGFHQDTWTIQNWVKVVEILNWNGIVPYIVGADTLDDHQYHERFGQVAAKAHLHWRGIVGRTPMPVIMSLLQDAAVWAGLNSGLGIVSTMLGTPTVMLWSDSKYPIKGAIVPLHENMKTSWFDQTGIGRPRDYRTLSFGSPELTPQKVVDYILEVRR